MFELDHVATGKGVGMEPAVEEKQGVLILDAQHQSWRPAWPDLLAERLRFGGQHVVDLFSVDMAQVSAIHTAEYKHSTRNRQLLVCRCANWILIRHVTPKVFYGGVGSLV
jgi:hypothetical protein